MLRCAYLLLLHQILKRSILDRIITRNSQHLKVIPTRSVAPMVDRFGCCGLCVCVCVPFRFGVTKHSKVLTISVS